MSGRYFFFVSVFTTRAIYMADFPAREKSSVRPRQFQKLIVWDRALQLVRTYY